MQENLEKMYAFGSKFGYLSKVGIQKVVNFPIVLTNGVSEVISAKHVFFTLYVEKLMKNGVIRTPEEFFKRKNPHLDPASLTEALLEFDSYVLTPVSPEMRSELSQKNSMGKIALNLINFALARTQVQQSIKSVTALRDFYHAMNEVRSTGSPESYKFLNDSAEQVFKQMMNVALYYGIAYMTRKGIASIAGATIYTVAANMVGDDEDKDRWRRLLRSLIKIERENQSNFTASQMMSDFVFFGAPAPAFLQGNMPRSVLSSVIDRLRMDSKTDEDVDSEIEVMTAEKNKILGEMAAATRRGTGTTEQFHQANQAVEDYEYGIQLLRTRRDRRDQWMQTAYENVVQTGTPLASSTAFGAKVQDYVPDWLKDAMYSVPEKDARSQELLKEARTSGAWWALSSYINFAAAEQKAARKATSEMAAHVVSGEVSHKKGLDEINKEYRLNQGHPPVPLREYDGQRR
jgi:hypothetical protein